MSSCIACDLITGQVPLAGGTIHATSRWVVEHCVGPLGLGTLIVKPTRHVTAIADLDDAETDELGPLLRLTARVVTDLVDADQVYCCLWSHAGGEPGHVHHVVQPVTREQVTEVGGPALQMRMFTENRPPDPDEVEVVAERARAAFARRT